MWPQACVVGASALLGDQTLQSVRRPHARAEWVHCDASRCRREVLQGPKKGLGSVTGVHLAGPPGAIPLPGCDDASLWGSKDLSVLGEVD